uniref:Uncharacterized protein n=1 Tax=Acrobeloides nanus TaxID=290746 RepID=A0A914CHK9_9BILA
MVTWPRFLMHLQTTTSQDICILVKRRSDFGSVGRQRYIRMRVGLGQMDHRLTTPVGNPVKFDKEPKTPRFQMIREMEPDFVPYYKFQKGLG